MDPRTLIKWLILAAIVYLVWPYDLLPDFLGLPGRLDDVLLMAWLAWVYRKHVRQFVAKASTREEQAPRGDASDGGSGTGSPHGSTSSKGFDAYEVLGVPRSASRDVVRAAYRSRMQEYHPDKVAHLGEELQALAHEKSQQIQRAYRQLHG